MGRLDATAQLILDRLAEGKGYDDILAEFPHLAFFDIANPTSAVSGGQSPELLGFLHIGGRFFHYICFPGEAFRGMPGHVSEQDPDRRFRI